MTKQPSTFQFVDIADIRGFLVLMKDNSLRAILKVESVNFELKSNDEQIGIIRGFQDFLNSLDFPVQIMVHSRKLDIGPYLKFLDETFIGLTNELLRVQGTEYRRFVKGLSELANIMDKKFYVIVPYFAVESRTGKGFKDAFKGLLGSGKSIGKISDQDLERYQQDLDQRLGLIISALTPLGLKTEILNQDKLIPLFSEYYNPPEATGKNVK